MTYIKAPTLIPLDMSKATKSSHPDIETSKEYLCLINNVYYSGHFSKQHYGLSFHGGPYVMQFDAPGYNSSNWQQIFEILNEEPLPESPQSKRYREAISEGLSQEPAYAIDVYNIYQNGLAEQTLNDRYNSVNRWEVEVTEELKAKYRELEGKMIISFFANDARGYPYANRVKAE